MTSVCEAVDGALGAIAARLSRARSGPADVFAAEIAALRVKPAPPSSPLPERRSLPVLRHWPRALAAASGTDAALGAALEALSPELIWRQNPNYVRLPPAADFLEGYGYAVIAGPGGLVPASIAVGVLLLGPRLLYPAHAHPAEEIYLVLEDGSRWWREGQAWLAGIGGTAIHHPPQVAHAMQAGEGPLCAIYLWRGDLATNAALTA
jgi:hypothetical protein